MASAAFVGVNGGPYRSVNGCQAHCVSVRTIVRSVDTASPHLTLAGLLMFVLFERHYAVFVFARIDVNVP
jgi:hypothetical protein